MSVSQVKKRFEDMEGYLCRDKEGLRRLKLLKDDVNVLRTSLAAAVSAKEDAEAIKDAARERADKAEAECKEAKLEVERLAAENESLRFQLKSLQPVAQSQANNDEDVGADEAERQFRSMIRSLRKRIGDVPRHKEIISVEKSKFANDTHMGDRGRISVWDVESFAKDWSHMEIWTLGAFVATWSLVWGGVTITSQKIFKNLPWTKSEDDDSLLVAKYFGFLMKHNVSNPVDATSRLYDAVDATMRVR